MANGGKREGAGRKPGARNKKSEEAIAAAKAKGLLPHEFLLAVMHGDVKLLGRPPTIEERLDAAGKAAPYYAPRLSAVDVKAKAPGELTFALVLERAKQNPKNRHKPRAD